MEKPHYGKSDLILTVKAPKLTLRWDDVAKLVLKLKKTLGLTPL